MHRIRYLVGSLVLLAAVLGAVWLVRLLQNLDARPGVPLQIEFHDARGLRAGADVRFRGVTVGTVRAVTVAADGEKAVASVLLEPGGAAQACVNSVFWIVTPRFGGLAGGASGLDTLVRDAYLAFATPAQRGSPLTGGSLLTGWERPPAPAEADALAAVEHGDLLMTLLVPENHGLRPGSPVTFRGLQTGEVRGIALAQQGTHVEVQLRIARRHRHTVTDQCAFWVARPALTGALFSGFTLTDVTALLSPFVAYQGEPGKGLPVRDGHRAAALASRPVEEPTAVPAAALLQPERPAEPPAPDLVLVRIVYAAVDHDFWSPDDPIHHEGTGVLFQDRAGRIVVATARSLVDGAYSETETFGSQPDIEQEQIQVMLPAGTVLRGARVWVHAGGRDLAALVLDEVPPDLLGTPADKLGFGGGEIGPDAQVRRVGADAAPAPPVALGGRELPQLAENLGGAVVVAGMVVGVYGRATAHADAPAVVPLDLLPEDLRPR
ncbi:MAG: MCE family protein [Planctomycetes bacterium]|nr:MCE family protein [Planctomycetota bacterium]